MTIPLAHDIGGDNDSKQHPADEQSHECRGYHIAAMAVVLPALSSCSLHIALLAVDVGFGAKDACESLHE